MSGQDFLSNFMKDNLTRNTRERECNCKEESEGVFTQDVGHVYIIDLRHAYMIIDSNTLTVEN